MGQLASGKRRYYVLSDFGRTLYDDFMMGTGHTHNKTPSPLAIVLHIIKTFMYLPCLSVTSIMAILTE